MSKERKPDLINPGYEALVEKVRKMMEPVVGEVADKSESAKPQKPQVSNSHEDNEIMTAPPVSGDVAAQKTLTTNQPKSPKTVSPPEPLIPNAVLASAINGKPARSSRAHKKSIKPSLHSTELKVPKPESDLTFIHPREKKNITVVNDEDSGLERAINDIVAKESDEVLVAEDTQNARATLDSDSQAKSKPTHWFRTVAIIVVGILCITAVAGYFYSPTRDFIVNSIRHFHSYWINRH